MNLYIQRRSNQITVRNLATQREVSTQSTFSNKKKISGGACSTISPLPIKITPVSDSSRSVPLSDSDALKRILQK